MRRRRSSSSAIASSRSTGSATPRSRCSTRPRERSARCARDGAVRQAITHSFRAVPELLAFVNALAGEMQGDPELDERFTLRRRRPLSRARGRAGRAARRRAGAGPHRRAVDGRAARRPWPRRSRGCSRRPSCATGTGAPRRARPDDIAILFRARAGHQYFEEALEARGIRTYVYKGLGFFDAPEVQDLQALLRYLAAAGVRPARGRVPAIAPRSRCRTSALARLGAGVRRARSRAPDFDAAAARPRRARSRAARPRARRASRAGSRSPIACRPASSSIAILRDSAYAFELRGRRLDQARENVKKVRALVRRVENRGYATLGRLADVLRDAARRRRVERHRRGARRREPDDDSRRQGPRVPDRLRRQPARARPRPAGGFSVIERGADGEPEVAFGHVTDGTRARGAPRDGRAAAPAAMSRSRARAIASISPREVGRRRTAATRPARSLAGAAAAGPRPTAVAPGAATSSERSSWESHDGSFAFRVCPTGAGRASGVRSPRAATRPRGRLVGAGAARRQVPSRRPSRRPIERRGRAAETSPAGITTRAAHRHARAPAVPAPASTDRDGRATSQASPVPPLVRVEELVDVADVPALCAERRGPVSGAAAAGRTSRRCSTAGPCFYEVPFSYQPRTVAADRCSFAASSTAWSSTPDGQVTVLEFKTGRPRPEHEGQASVYADAIGGRYSAGTDVAVKIVYP